MQRTGDVQTEPGTSRAEQKQAVLRDGVVAEEIGPAGLRDLQLVLGDDAGLHALDVVGAVPALAGHVRLYIIRSLDDIATDIKGITLYSR